MTRKETLKAAKQMIIAFVKNGKDEICVADYTAMMCEGSIIVMFYDEKRDCTKQHIYNAACEFQYACLA